MKYISVFILLCIKICIMCKASNFESKCAHKRSFLESTKLTMQDHRKKFSTIGYMLSADYNVILTRVEPLDITKLGIQDLEIANVIVLLSEKRVETSCSNFDIISKSSQKIEDNLQLFISNLNKKESFLAKIDKELYAEQIVDFICKEPGACIADTKFAHNKGPNLLITDKTKSRLLLNDLEQLLQDMVCKDNLRLAEVLNRYQTIKKLMDEYSDILDSSTRLYAEKSLKRIEKVLSRRSSLLAVDARKTES